MRPSRPLPLLSLGLVAVAAAGLLSLGLAGCGDGREPLRVFAADALKASFDDVEAEYEKLHPDTDVILDIHGSILLCRMVPMRRGDVVAVADHRLVEKILAPKHADWVAKFASTEIVLAGHSGSRYRDEINGENWFDILLRDDVTYGIADPSQDPCGYYTRLCWELAEDHYFTDRGEKRPLARQLAAGCPKKHIARDALSLISELLSIGRVDYAFVYRVHARDLKLPFTLLPSEINLGDPALADHYESAQALVPNYRGGTETMTGTYIAFGLTIPPDALNPQGARDFVAFLLSDRGRAILARSEFVPIQPALVPAWGQMPDLPDGLLAPDDGPEPPPGKTPATAAAP
ncbi:MAG: extracellular solute-binding protein [bacterium]